MTVLLVVLGAWVLVGAAAALVIGRAVHAADVLELASGAPPQAPPVLPAPRGVLAQH